MAPDLCKVAPQPGAELSDVQEKPRYGAELRSVEAMTELLIAVNALLYPAAIGAQDGAEALKGLPAGLEELAALCKETGTGEETNSDSKDGASSRKLEMAAFKEALISGQQASGLTIFQEGLAAEAVRRVGCKSTDERNTVLISVAEGGRTGKAIVLTRHAM